MEEYYRRRYGGPFIYHSETEQRNKRVDELRKQLSTARQNDLKLVQLHTQMAEIKRQNLKMIAQQQQIEAQYMQKMQKNKERIKQIKNQMKLQMRLTEELDHNSQKLAQQCTKLISQLRQMKKNAEKNDSSMTFLQKKVVQQDSIKISMTNKKKMSQQKAQQLKNLNEKQSSELQARYKQIQDKKEVLKKSQNELQKQQILLEHLKSQKQQIKRKLANSALQLESIDQENILSEKEAKRTINIVQSLQQQQLRHQQNRQSSTVASKNYTTNSKQVVDGLKSRVELLLSSMKGEGRSSCYLEGLKVREEQTRRCRVQLQEHLKSLCEVYGEEQENYSRIIGMMKNSIQQDEKAIESLSRQAQHLEKIMI